MRACLTFCLAIGLLPVPATSGEDICAALGSGDASLGANPDRCVDSLLADGGAQTSCYWSFDYRAPDAQTRLEEWHAAIATCLGPGSELPADQQVNHPDSYALHRFEGQGRRVSLSLKDKAGLGKTLIFLSVEK